MRNKKQAIKWIIAITLAIITLLQASLHYFSYARANYTDQLGSNTALGSPILNNEFVADDWNKWEMIAWGVFLSNFATPLLDDYNSAFNSNSASGSKGSGYKALQFGSGSDPANAQVLQSLLNAAITQQKVGQLKQVYVRHTDVTGEKGIITSEDSAYNNLENTEIATSDIDGDIVEGGLYRTATLADFIFATKKADGDTYMAVSDINGKVNFNATTWSTDFGYKVIYTFEKGSLPTFSIKRTADSKHETVFDYTNSWDVQLLNAWFGRILASDLSSEFASELNEMWDNAKNIPVSLDCFGNLVVTYKDSNRILIPASANQHITETKSINLINSLIFNGYLSSVNSKNLQLVGQQMTWDTWGWLTFRGGNGSGGTPDKSGVPAFGSRINGVRPGTVNLYFDLDTIIVKQFIENGKKLDAAMADGTLASGSTTVDEIMGEIHYGSKVKELFNTDIENLTGEYALKIEVSNLAETNIGKLSKKVQTAVENTSIASAMITNSISDNPKAKVLSTVVGKTKDITLLDDAVIVSVQSDVGLNGVKVNIAGAARLFPTFLMDVYNGKVTETTAGRLDRKMVEDILDRSKTVSNLRVNFIKTANEKITYLAAGFVAKNTDLFTVNLTSPSNLMSATSPATHDFFQNIGDVKYGGVKAVTPKYSLDKNEDSIFQRMVKVYPVSDTMVNISNALGTRNGTDFATWSTYIYMTYLDWYGVTLKKELGKEPQMISNFNTRIFDDKSDILKLDINSIADIKTAEDKKKDVLNYTYLMLHPTEGREYRTNLIMSGLSDWVYRNYNNIVYGNASSYYSQTNSKLATRSATGFLNIDSYSDNPATSWFMNIYTDAAVWIIVLSFVLVIVVGLLKSRKISWFFTTVLIIINSILIIPSAGEIVPYISNKYVQQMFNGKMTYWSISEAITNANMEKDMLRSTDNGNLTVEEAAQVSEMTKALNVVHLDRALMLKTDISRKITETSSGNFADLQKLRSARWMLPMLMRQFTANDMSADYVFIPAGDLFDDLSNMYWLYNESDAASVNTVNARSNGGIPYIPTTLVSNIKAYFPDYRYSDEFINDKWSSLAYYSEDDATGELYAKNKNDIIHSYFYLLDGTENGVTMLSRNVGFNGDYTGKESYENYVKNSLLMIPSSSLTSLSSELEGIAGEYIRSDRSTVHQKYGYLWTTENPAHYFYQTIKDTFQSSDTLGSIVGSLQGTYVVNDNSKEVRKSFMHSYDTGTVRDIADLEGLFRNTLPYVYQMMLLTGGLDGESGLLGDSKITNYDIYNNNNKSWMYRSNWVVKIMENTMYTNPTVVRDSDGKEHTVINPTLPDCYPSNRPMIFSEAQRVALGLNEADLTLLELKCININKNVARSWTLLLNYANTSGISKEVMMRQMALNTLIEFNKEFSPAGLFSGSKAMYPNSIDLRAISFDSVMKMLMLNVTKDVSYIRGDTMKTIVEDSDIFTAILLLLASFLCCYIIPLFRNIVLAAIFYLGLLSIIRAIVSGHNTKAKVSMGYVISNILFLIITVAYYAIFSALMAMTTTDELLTVQSVQVSVGNPVWSFIIIILFSSAYIYSMYKMLNLCFKNFRDMGYEIYAGIAQVATSGIANKLESIGSRITSWGSGGSESISSSNSGATKIDKKDITSVKIDSGNVNAEVIRDDVTRDSRKKHTTEYSASSYTSKLNVNNIKSDEDEINAKIEKGKSMGKSDNTDMYM